MIRFFLLAAVTIAVSCLVFGCSLQDSGSTEIIVHDTVYVDKEKIVTIRDTVYLSDTIYAVPPVPGATLLSHFPGVSGTKLVQFSWKPVSNVLGYELSYEDAKLDPSDSTKMVQFWKYVARFTHRDSLYHYTHSYSGAILKFKIATIAIGGESGKDSNILTVLIP